MSYSLPEVKRQSYYYQLMNMVSCHKEYEPFQNKLMDILILLTDNIEMSKQKYDKIRNKLGNLYIVSILDKIYNN
jgi:two-component SAPR family response regulator